MKQKKYFILAAAAILMAACSENDIAEKQSPQVAGEGDPVNFSAYLNRGVTRAGQTGILTTANLQSESDADKSKTGGFGVLGYYTNDENYGQTAKPDFFYNQKVYWNSSNKVWEYSPVKYWPNEFGTTAISEGEDKLTFFAYAPYVPVDVNTGIAQRTETATPEVYEDELETGIIAITRNTAFGDPYVKYYASFDPEKCVDLCFGVAKADFKSSVDGELNNVKKGNPYIDVKKPKLTDRINFDFKHALAQLNVQIDADVEQMSHGTNNYLDGETRVFVREVTFEGFADKGMLNLNSVAESSDYAPKWVDLSGVNEIKSGKVTIYDGRRDGREGQPNAGVTNENPQTLNTNIICNDAYSTPGVPATAPCNLFNNSSSDASVLVIPTTEALRVTIVYDVETKDDNLAGFLCDGQTHGSSVENKITKEITLGGQGLVLKAGKKYTVSLHLGMNSVKFDASVTDWAEDSFADVDLPVNAPIFEVSAGTASVNVPYNKNDEFVFGINGFNGGEAVGGVETTDVDDMLSDQSSNSANASGLAKQTVKIAENATVSKKEAICTWTGASSGKDLAVTFIQAPHPLELAVASFEAGSSKKINLKAGATPASGKKWNDDGVIKYIKVYRNGAKLDEGDPTTKDNEFLYTAPSTATAADLGYITVKALNAGDVYTIVMKAGDADEETITWSLKAGSVSFAPIFNDGTLGSTITITKGDNIEIVGDGTLSGVSSSYTDVATTSSTTITTVAAGITTITATITDGKEYHYDPASVSTTLVISQDFASGASGSYGTGTVKVRKEGGTGTIRITGMTPNAVLKVEEPLNEMFESISFDQERVGTSGIVTVTYKVKNNATSAVRSASFTVWHGSATPKGATITVTQQAGS